MANMTFDWPEPIPDWDLMKWKEETQLQIYDEIKDMTTAEMIDYFRQAGARFDEELEQRRAQQERDNQC